MSVVTPPAISATTEKLITAGIGALDAIVTVLAIIDPHVFGATLTYALTVSVAPIVTATVLGYAYFTHSANLANSALKSHP